MGSSVCQLPYFLGRIETDASDICWWRRWHVQVCHHPTPHPPHSLMGDMIGSARAQAARQGLTRPFSPIPSMSSICICVCVCVCVCVFVYLCYGLNRDTGLPSQWGNLRPCCLLQEQGNGKLDPLFMKTTDPGLSPGQLLCSTAPLLLCSAALPHPPLPTTVPISSPPSHQRDRLVCCLSLRTAHSWIDSGYKMNQGVWPSVCSLEAVFLISFLFGSLSGDSEQKDRFTYHS